MARMGRRLTIGGSGLALSDEDSLSQTGSRGEVRRYAPPTEDEQARMAAQIPATAPAPETPPDEPITVVIPPESGGGDGSGGEGGGGEGGDGGGGEGGGGEGGGGEGDGGPGGGGEFAKGGAVGGKGKEVITAHAGEFVINKAAVKKYGMRMLRAINAGRAQIQASSKPSRRLRRLA